ncbi:cysteine hydrolase family protein [Bacillus gaemokensis]|uniref:Isochorismatase n=1 Tax=Bacillus gaemokensis TaxID=574375 RepID=A0A073K839_9BACI|nr:cysteine hydrolase family protein [Bacillus gaemokensis]KEK22637.1 isochorismatase [Bacillus gaemokensis]KYG28937.1 isochorismatase [Bacillus gaemokensis]
MNRLPKNAALILVDIQKGFDDSYWGQRNNIHAETNMELILQTWRKTNRPVIHVQHISNKEDHPLRKESSGSEFKDFATPLVDEPVFQKNVNSAFIGTNLEIYLREHNYDTAVIIGLTTDYCISTSVRMAGNLGFLTYVISDATATFDRIAYDENYYHAEDIHNIALVSLHEMFATVLTTDKLIELV